MNLWPRALLVAGQVATLVATWPLWSARSVGPPMLPLIELPAFDAGPLLLGTVLIALARPRPGVWLHVLALGAAIIADQTRLQPTVISFALLLVATLPRNAPLAPAHLAALWIWAGVHKLLSPAFLTTTAPWLFGHAEVGLAFALAEVSLGLLVLSGSARQLAAFAAFALHGTLAFALLARGEFALVPWNLVLAGAGLMLPRRRARSLDAVLLLLPLGFYLGATDAYFAHVLYTGGVASTVRCTAEACRSDRERDETVAAFGVPLEPEPRLLRAHFDATCVPGEELFLTGPETWLHEEPQTSSTPCPY